MKQWLNYLIGIIAMVAFAYITSYAPQHASIFFLAYFVVIMAFLFLTTGRSASKIMREVEEIKRSSKVMEIRKETVSKLRVRDADYLAREMKPQVIVSLLTILPMIIVFAIILWPGMRDALVSTVQASVISSIQDKRMSLFIAYLVFYSLFYVISLVPALIARVYQSGHGGMLVIASSYYVGEKGIVLDDRTPLKFADLGDAEITFDEKRKFVELKARVKMGLGTSESRVRLYHPQPRQLYAVLKGLIERYSRQLAEQR